MVGVSMAIFPQERRWTMQTPSEYSSLIEKDCQTSRSVQDLEAGVFYSSAVLYLLVF